LFTSFDWGNIPKTNGECETLDASLPAIERGMTGSIQGNIHPGIPETTGASMAMFSMSSHDKE